MDYTAPSCDEIDLLARETLAKLPHAFRKAAADVVIQVGEFADDDTLEELDADSFDLTGIYLGVPLTEKSSMDQPMGPDVIWLFRRPILDEWAERGDVTIAELVRHVTIHELAHHFGWSDDDIATIDQWWT